MGKKTYNKKTWTGKEVKMDVKRNVSGMEGLCVIEPGIFNHNQNFFYETYNKKEFNEKGLTFQFVQDNEVFSKKGVLRGMHINIKHPQGKFIQVIKGHIYDVVVDLRKESRTYKKWFGIELSDRNRKRLYIPERMGHGYLALEDSIVLMKVTTYYIADDEIPFSWKSDELNIQWPTAKIQIIQNEKDQHSRDLSEIQI